MLLAILLTIYGIMFILALIHVVACVVSKHELTTRKKYQEHIDDLVEELSPPSIPTVNTPTANEPDPQYQEAKRKMIADIRTYFNQRKINAAVAKIPGPDELAPVNPSAGSYEELTFPTPPSIN